MNIVFKGIKTGAEIWDIIKHPLLNESDWDKTKQYEFTQYDKVTKKGVICSESKPVPTEQEIVEQAKHARIQELKQVISDKSPIVDIMSPEELEQFNLEKQEYKELVMPVV